MSSQKAVSANKNKMSGARCCRNRPAFRPYQHPTREMKMPASGAFRTWRDLQVESAIGGKADITFPARCLLLTYTSRLHGVRAPGFERVDGQKAERTFRVAIAKQRVWNIGSILQGVACSVLLRLVAAISGFGDTLDDVDRPANRMPVKR